MPLSRFSESCRFESRELPVETLAVLLTEHRYVARNPNYVPITTRLQIFIQTLPFKRLLYLFPVRFITSQIAPNKPHQFQRHNTAIYFSLLVFIMRGKGVPFKADNECETFTPLSLNHRLLGPLNNTNTNPGHPSQYLHQKHLPCSNINCIL